MRVPFREVARPAVLRDGRARLGRLEVHGARAAAIILLEIVGYALIAIQRPHAGSFDRTDVYESIGAPVFRLDEAITFVGIKELYGSGDHLMFSFCGGPPIGPDATRGERRKKEPQSAEDRPIATISYANVGRESRSYNRAHLSDVCPNGSRTGIGRM